MIFGFLLKDYQGLSLGMLMTVKKSSIFVHG
jgi:hypothetical protein